MSWRASDGVFFDMNDAETRIVMKAVVLLLGWKICAFGTFLVISMNLRSQYLSSDASFYQ